MIGIKITIFVNKKTNYNKEILNNCYRWKKLTKIKEGEK